MRRFRVWFLVVGWSWMLPLNLHAQPDDKVIRALMPDQAADLLKSLNLDFKKEHVEKAQVHYFDFTRNKFKIRLHLMNAGKELMLDALFPVAPLNQVNQWNVKARFTRAVIDRDKQGQYTALESNLNLAGGVTLEAVKLFFVSFDEELAAFQKFIATKPGDGEIYTNLSNERLENLLKDANIPFQKNVNPNGLGLFVFKTMDCEIRLHNFGGKDLMLDAHFGKMDLEDANQWNLKKKFIRTVVYTEKGKTYSALEANLDITGGVTDGIVRQFLAAFSEDLAEFQNYLKILNKKKDSTDDKD